MSTVPIIDFSAYSLGVDKNKANKDSYQNLVNNMHQAFSTVGCLYLKNHGIPQQQIEHALSTARQFFSLPIDTKRKYVRGDLDEHGWLPLGTERLQMDRERPGCLKESFDARPPIGKIWPEEEVPDFKPAVDDLFDSCKQLACRIHELIAVGLELPDTDIFNKAYRSLEHDQTSIRTLHYPAITKETVVKPGQIRCGEHTDYGSLTIIYQDDASGLEVLDREAKRYFPVPYVPGTVVINIGDAMQRWTADKLLSTIHRVVIPETKDPKTNLRARQSIACLIRPDSDYVLECVDGSKKYPPITAGDYLNSRFADTMKALSVRG